MKTEEPENLKSFVKQPPVFRIVECIVGFDTPTAESTLDSPFELIKVIFESSQY